jgi:hypothetical protein
MRRLALLLAPLVLLSLPACSDGNGSGDMNLGVNAAGTGHLEVRLTDAPLDLATAANVWVLIDSVAVTPEGTSGGEEMPPIPLSMTPGEFDLLTLTGGATTLLASGDLPVGRYSKIWMHVPSGRIVFLDGREEPLKLDSQKVDVPIAFDLSLDENLQTVLDFDAEASIQVNGTANETYILRPVVTPVSNP